MKKIILPFFSFARPGKAQMKAEDVNTFTLKNGMKVLVVEDFLSQTLICICSTK
jgi:hypothetical protein